ncbi:MAG: hypothetical protein SNG49_04085 [Rikenellaceae bacterium]
MASTFDDRLLGNNTVGSKVEVTRVILIFFVVVAAIRDVIWTRATDMHFVGMVRIDLMLVILYTATHKSC